MAELIEQLDPNRDYGRLTFDEVKSAIERGEIEMQEGKGLPVLVDARTKRRIKGSGIPPRAVDIGEVSRQTAHQRTQSYRQALETLANVDGDADQRGSFLWWLEQAMQAAEGSPKAVTCPECSHKWTEEMAVKNGALIFKIIEMLHGRATEVKEVNLKVQAMQEILTHRTDATEVYALTDEEIQARRDFIEGKFNDVD